ncbi:FYVE, RhoGEF and PH domain-containing protein 4-like isoform X3 [Amphiura filiformis]|uniref:FYVE, RhoGEF and PH domain-containing protein 4-like isoform X3 n=1 Tax=Amphiura filiformis TaxID=82378 RepID=UPI003B21DC97
MLEVPKSTIKRIGGSTKSEDSDFGSTGSDRDSGSDDWDSWDSTSDSQQAPEPINFIDESHKVAYEVLTSERTYVERLSLLDQAFLARIERENEKAHWFSNEVVKEIFSNLRSIYAFHHNFLLPDLENRLKQWEENPSIGDILRRLAPFLKLYSDYVSNFDNSMKLLNLWSQKAPKFGSLLSEIQRQPQCMNLALQHHMLEPVQRIPRYELLLKDYLKRLPQESLDRKDAEEAMTRIAQAAHHSNDMMKTTDQFQKLLKLNEKIEGEDIIDPSRQLLKEGKIVKIAARGGSQQKEMYLFLFNDMMLCCVRGKILKRVNYTVKHKLDVDGMKILDAEDCKFRVESKQKALELQTTSEEEKEEWMKSIISTVHEMHRKKQTFINNDAMNDRPASEELGEGRELGMRAPRWIKDEEVTMCMRCGTDFKAITRRRHHCRACGAVVCNKCSSYEAQLPYDDNKMNRVCYKCYYTFKGEEEGAKEQMRRIKHEQHEDSLITEIDEENSYSSFLNVLQKREWVRFWVVATKQDLFALKAPKDVRPVLTLPIKLYKICEISESDNVDKPHAFKLSDGSRSQHVFAADNRELKKRWLMVFNDGVESVLKTKYMTESDDVFMDAPSSSPGSFLSFSSSHKSYTVNAT